MSHLGEKSSEQFWCKNFDRYRARVRKVLNNFGARILTDIGHMSHLGGKRPEQLYTYHGILLPDFGQKS